MFCLIKPLSGSPARKPGRKRGDYLYYYLSLMTVTVLCHLARLIEGEPEEERFYFTNFTVFPCSDNKYTPLGNREILICSVDSLTVC